MATEAQRLIGISLAKIAQSRCGRGGVSLHKNLLVATVLQKARFIFMEEAYHMVHGHYLQATNKFLEPEITSPVEDDDLVDTDSELDDIFNAPISSIGKDSEDDDDSDQAACDKENNPPETLSGLTYFDLDEVKIRSRTELQTTTPEHTSSNKRRREISEHETEEAVLSILPKRIKADAISTAVTTSTTTPSDNTEQDQHHSLFNDDEYAATSLSENVAREFELAREELNNNNSSNNNNLSSHHRTTDDEQQQQPMQTGPAMEGIDRITSLVSIFSFGNLTRSMSTPDLCSAQAKDTNSEPQRTFLAMTV